MVLPLAVLVLAALDEQNYLPKPLVSKGREQRAKQGDRKFFATFLGATIVMTLVVFMGSASTWLSSLRTACSRVRSVLIYSTRSRCGFFGAVCMSLGFHWSMENDYQSPTRRPLQSVKQ